MCLASGGNWNVITQVIRRDEASPWTCLQQGSWLPPGQVVQERKRESQGESIIFHNLTSEMTDRYFCQILLGHTASPVIAAAQATSCPAFPWPDQVPEKQDFSS